MKSTASIVGIAVLALFATACEKAKEEPQKDDHGHAHENGGHGHDQGAGSGGVVARLVGPEGADAGYVELKLHDDKGDLELWLAKDAQFTTPLDVPLDTKITVTFVDKGNRTVELRARNRDRNEDEDGKANIRDGKTNYFIFPGDSGQDASWLKGGSFLATTKVSLQSDGKALTTPSFVLKPHAHGDDHGHKH